ncbi:hypothetical protein HGRIS_000443 [Hohenbuehelia grisea]|uniref:G-protein coupled receptors family 2 profile 2 domain-containing protein n=1 Tax=Hohenbuehelia grisea TaxID=104357 RepID=A0ABR3JR27_9AGAR
MRGWHGPSLQSPFSVLQRAHGIRVLMNLMKGRLSRGGEQSSPDPTLVVISITCLISGLGLSLLILATASLSPRIKRLSTWFNLLITGIVFAISNLLLIGHQSGPQPPFGLCLFQAMMLYGVPALASFSSAIFCIEMLLLVRHVLRADHKKTVQPARRYLLAIPWIAHLGIALAVLVMGLKQPWRVLRDDETSTYCHLKAHIPARVTAGLTICGVLITLIALALTIHALYRNRDDASMQQFRHDSMINRMVLRIIIFSILPVVALILSILKFPSKVLGTRIFVIMLSLFPLWSAVVLGLHADIFRAWAFWKRTPEEPTKSLASSEYNKRGAGSV